MGRKFDRPVAPLPGFSKVRILGTRPMGDAIEIHFRARWKFEGEIFPFFRELLERNLKSPCIFLREVGRRQQFCTILWSRFTTLSKGGGTWDYLQVQQYRLNAAYITAQKQFDEVNMECLVRMDQEIINSLRPEEAP